MKKQMFNNLKELFDEIKFLEDKISKLEKISQSNKFSNIQIHFFADKNYYTIYQQDSPFNMENELRILIEGMIEQMNNDLDNLKLQF